MKTLTVTYHHTTNYGAVLQAYALQQSILSMGHENVILETKLKSKKKRKKITLRQLYLNYLSWLRREENHRLLTSFSDFHKNRMQLTRPYVSMTDLRDNPPDVDCLITGSDQVWNFATVPSMLDSRLLRFGDESAIRFSYAASMEELCLSDEQKELLKDTLSRYKGISVREQSAKEYIESFTPYDCQRVLDPVFLLSQEKWNEIAINPRIKGPYILCYQVQRNDNMQKVASQLQKQTGLPIVSICNSTIKWIKSDYTFYDVSIEEFLGFYRDASYIVSASFHGIAMGLVYEKPVYALIKQNRANRLKDIMNLFGLGDYIVRQGESVCIKQYQEDDLRGIHEKKEALIMESMDYLKKMFSE